ncbi:MAG: PAS domain S-box protein [Deltaproteobacteria bacterium]|nr:PAS domain S-box protein [Deltaproteobacteria bacterium]
MRILGWLRDPALERRVGRCADAVGLEFAAAASAPDAVAALDRPDVALVVVRAVLLDDALRRALVRWALPDAVVAAATPARVVLQLGAARGAPTADFPRLVLPGRPSAAVLEEALRALGMLVVAAAGAQERAARLAAAVDVTRRLAARHDFREILFEAARRIAEVVAVERASILLVDPAAGELRVVATSDDASIRDLRLDLVRYPEVREVLVGHVPVYLADVSTDPRLEQVRRQFGAMRARASYLFPVEDEEHVVVGLLALKTAPGGRLEDEQIAACQVVATACAPALHNARAMRQLERQAAGSQRERLEAERQVQSLARYASFFESAADGLIVIDPGGAILYANPAAATILGDDSGRVPVRLAEVFDESGRAGFAALLDGFSRGRFPIVDLALGGTGGAPRVVQVSSSPVLREEGACLLSVRDVSAERSLAHELQRTKTFLERVLDSSPDAIVAADMHGTILLFNRAAERLTGHRAEEVLGRMHIDQLYGSRDQARELMARLRAADQGGIGRLAPTRSTVRSRGGDEITVAVSAAVIYEEGQEVATCGIFTDLRDRMRIEERLAQTQERLALTEKQAIVSEISGAMAHELNQPLTSVMGYAELLRKTLAEDARGRAYVETILRETERMAELVKKIGRLGRYETKGYVGGTQILDLDRSTEESK